PISGTSAGARSCSGCYDPTRMGHMSNRDRIARAAEEAEIAAQEKAAKKKSGGSKGHKPDVRMKVIWEVCDPAGRAVRSFPYADKARAEAELQARTRSSGVTHILRPAKVPMDEGF